jgi:hypothetical protein
MRPYKVSDLFAFTEVLTAAARAGGGLGRILKAGGALDGEKSAEERGVTLVSFVLCECLSSANKELKAWLAGLCDMTEEQFLAQPATTLLDLIEGIATSPESKDFFYRASALFRKMSGSGTATASD